MSRAMTQDNETTRSVLIVDTDPDVAAALAEILRPQGYAAQSAETPILLRTSRLVKVYRADGVTVEAAEASQVEANWRAARKELLLKALRWRGKTKKTTES